MTVWKIEWGEKTLHLYDNMMKAEATALFLLQIKVLGLNCWLIFIGVRGKLPHYSYEWRAQTVTHVLKYCLYYDSRGLASLTGTGDLKKMLSRPANVKKAAQWLVNKEIMDQFRVAKEMNGEGKNVGDYYPF